MARAGGVLVLDKPAAMSSAGAVDRVKHELGVKRAGHGGTLDPIATGVLAICLDEATKLASYLLADDKEYEAELVLGIETDTLDRTGAVIAEKPCEHVTREAILAALAKRTGEYDQIPPMYSAIKQGGIRLYKQARAGVEVERIPRRIRIDRLELRSFVSPRVTIEIACGKGTYVRSLVTDLGADLGCGAHLAELRRTRSGRFALDRAQQLGTLDRDQIIPLSAILTLPAVKTPEAMVPIVRSGVQQIIDKLPPVPAEGMQFQLVEESGELLAIVHTAGGKLIYDRVFPA